MPLMPIRDVKLFVEVVGRGYPLLLMHGGPGTDHWTLLPFRQLRDRFTLIFYDHRCNGRSEGAPVESMTFDNLTADAAALRQKLGYEKWAILGHSFGGHVALEFALRYPESVSHLVLMDTGADGHWARENAPRVLAERGYPAKKVELVRRWFNGEFRPQEMFSIFRRIGDAYQYNPSLMALIRALLEGAWRIKFRGDTLAYAGREMKDWSVVDRLGEIDTPTLVIAGRQDFVFPPDCQEQLAAGIPGADLHLVDRAGHNPHSEQTAQVMKLVRQFIQPQSATSARPAYGRAAG
jgi:proline iminopeptidase